MAKRRGNDEGSVYQDKDGVWWAQLPPDHQGRRPKRRAKTRKEAFEKLRQMQKERSQGVDLTTKQPTVEVFAATWLEQVVKRSGKATTYSSYAFVLRQYVLPSIGTTRLDRLTTPQVQQMVNDLIDENYAARTIRNGYLRLRAMLDVAVLYKLIPYNVAIGVKLPKIDKDTQRAMALTEVHTLLTEFVGHRNEALYYCYFGLGLRRGEGLGLLWRDLDWENGTIKITQQIQTVENKTVANTPKNDKTRTLPVPEYLLTMLREHWRNQQEERRLLGVNWKEHGLIFASEVGTPIGPRNLNRQFGDARERSGLPEDIHVHTARHTCATMLGELDTEERVIGAILGHTPGNVTAYYAKVTMPMMRSALEALAQQINRKAA